MYTITYDLEINTIRALRYSETNKKKEKKNVGELLKRNKTTRHTLAHYSI